MQCCMHNCLRWSNVPGLRLQLYIRGLFSQMAPALGIEFTSLLTNTIWHLSWSYECIFTDCICCILVNSSVNLRLLVVALDDLHLEHRGSHTRQVSARPPSGDVWYYYNGSSKPSPCCPGNKCLPLCVSQHVLLLPVKLCMYCLNIFSVFLQLYCPGTEQELLYCFPVSCLHYSPVFPAQPNCVWHCCRYHCCPAQDRQIALPQAAKTFSQSFIHSSSTAMSC